MAKLEPWEGRQLVAIELLDSYPDCECALKVMGTAVVFQKGTTDPEHPYSRTKELSLTYAEAESILDRFSIEPAPEPQPKTLEPDQE